MTTTFALTIDVLAFAVGQVLQQVFQSALAPVWHLGRRGHRLDLLHDRLTEELRPVATRAVHIRNRANVGATRALFGTTRFLFHVDMEATVDFLAFSATNTETAHAALFGQYETGRSRNDAQNLALVVQFAMIFEAGDDVGHWEPQALAPGVVLTEGGAILILFDFDALSAIFARLKRMAAAFATAVLFDAISFGHHLQEFFVSGTAPVWNVRTECAGFESLGEHAPFAADQRRRRQIANLSVLRARRFFAVNR